MLERDQRSLSHTDEEGDCEKMEKNKDRQLNSTLKRKQEEETETSRELVLVYHCALQPVHLSSDTSTLNLSHIIIAVGAEFWCVSTT